MIPELKLTTGNPIYRPLVCLVNSDEVPEFINLNDDQRNLVTCRLREKKESVFLDLLDGFVAIVRIKDDLPVYRQHEELRKTASRLCDRIRESGFDYVTVTGDGVLSSMVLAFTEGLILALYRFDRYKTLKTDENKGIKTVNISFAVAEKDFEWLKLSCEAVYDSRNMINEPPLGMNARLFAEEVRRISHQSGFSAEVLDKSRIAALKMGGLLGINHGSIDPPEFCILEYRPAGALNLQPLVLIGKGVVLDTGGLNIKTGDYMDLMKTDMAGGAAVAGAMSVIARAGLPLYTVGLIPVTDNRPGQNAIAPGDILKMHNGTTVEIVNTDAEGRVILADAISYASKYDPMLIITIATLTGSAARTFGNIASAMMGNAPEEFLNLMEQCGEEVFERVARLPFWDEYGEALKSDIADIKNLGGKEGGAISAGKFLASFTKAPFIHIDVAGTATLKNSDYYRLKEGPATGVRLLSAFAKHLSDGILKRNN